MDKVRDSEYKTFLFATTEYGKVINLISYDEFPDELFLENEEQECIILFGENVENENNSIFYYSQ